MAGVCLGTLSRPRGDIVLPLGKAGIERLKLCFLFAGDVSGTLRKFCGGTAGSLFQG